MISHREKTKRSSKRETVFKLNIIDILSENGNIKCKIKTFNCALLYSTFPLKLVADGLKYLWIFITSYIKDPFIKNFQPLMDKCKLEMDR